MHREKTLTAFADEIGRRAHIPESEYGEWAVPPIEWMMGPGIGQITHIWPMGLSSDPIRIREDGSGVINVAASILRLWFAVVGGPADIPEQLGISKETVVSLFMLPPVALATKIAQSDSRYMEHRPGLLSLWEDITPQQYAAVISCFARSKAMSESEAAYCWLDVVCAPPAPKPTRREEFRTLITRALPWT